MDKETILRISMLLGSGFFFRIVYFAFKSGEVHLGVGEGGIGSVQKRRENPTGFYFVALIYIFIGVAMIGHALFQPSEFYHENGQLQRKDSYKDGERDGLFEGYPENGEFWFKTSYKDGKREVPWEYYEGGSRIPFTGETVMSHLNGEVSSRGFVRDGKREGPWEFYHGNGSISMKGSYKDGEQEGLFLSLIHISEPTRPY